MSVRRACVHPRLVNDFGTVRVFWQGDIVNSNRKREGSNHDWKGEIGVREEEQSTGASLEESQ